LTLEDLSRVPPIGSDRVKHLVPHEKRPFDPSTCHNDSVAEREKLTLKIGLTEVLSVGDYVPTDLIEIGGASRTSLGQAPPERILRQ
jgi:hypothetical protein